MRGMGRHSVDDGRKVTLRQAHPRLRRYARPYWQLVGLIPVLSLVTAAMGVRLPQATGVAANERAVSGVTNYDETASLEDDRVTRCWIPNGCVRLSHDDFRDDAVSDVVGGLLAGHINGDVRRGLDADDVLAVDHVLLEDITARSQVRRRPELEGARS